VCIVPLLTLTVQELKHLARLHLTQSPDPALTVSGDTVRQLAKQTRDPVISSIVQDLESKKLLDKKPQRAAGEEGKKTTDVGLKEGMVEMQSDQPAAQQISHPVDQSVELKADTPADVQQQARPQLVDNVQPAVQPPGQLFEHYQLTRQLPGNVQTTGDLPGDVQPGRKMPEDVQPARKVPEDVQPARKVPEDVQPARKVPEDVQPAMKLPEDVQLGSKIAEEKQKAAGQPSSQALNDRIQNHRSGLDESDPRSSADARVAKGTSRAWLLPGDQQLQQRERSPGSSFVDRRQLTAGAQAWDRDGQLAGYAYTATRPQQQAAGQQPFWYQQLQQQQQLQHQQLLEQHVPRNRKAFTPWLFKFESYTKL
jgi:hypothetical protein